MAAVLVGRLGRRVPTVPPASPCQVHHSLVLLRYSPAQS